MAGAVRESKKGIRLLVKNPAGNHSNTNRKFVILFIVETGITHSRVLANSLDRCLEVFRPTWNGCNCRSSHNIRVMAENRLPPPWNQPRKNMS
jgi:hypothetical protein